MTATTRDDRWNDREAAMTDLDAPQEFETATSLRVRDEFEDLVRRDLLGPWDGEWEQLEPNSRGPRNRYLVGMLGPKDVPASSSDSGIGADALDQADAGREHENQEGAESDVPGLEDGGATEVGDGGAELPDIRSTLNRGRIWASSFGLSFRVVAGVHQIMVTASWGSYSRQDVKQQGGTTRRVWAREPVEYEHAITLDEGARTIGLTSGDAERTGVYLHCTVRARPDGDRVVELSLVNAKPAPQGSQDTAWLFQPILAVASVGGEAVFCPVNDPLDDPLPLAPDGRPRTEDDTEEAHLRLLYRHHRRYATGRNVAVDAECRDSERMAHRLRTTWLPAYDLPPTMAPDDPSSPLADVLLSMDELATASPARLRDGLLPLADGYGTWIDRTERTLDSGLPEPLRQTAVEAVVAARAAAARIRAGIELLTDPTEPGHADAVQAFVFMNQAMAHQRRRTTLVRRREDLSETYAQAMAEVDAQGDEVASWRPFQLAFVLLNLPSLTDPAHPERQADPEGVVDLLFFPTGGGKTEAYLGLTAYILAIRRLQGVVGAGAGARDGADGVAVLMRYTLRLLTAQQFQRAAALICATEWLRRQDETAWGRTPFRIGLWVGYSVAPNFFDDASEQIADARQRANDSHTNVLALRSCPWCGERLTAVHNLEASTEERRIRLFCPNAEGVDACVFSRRATAEGIPVLSVDEEIYRLVPSLVIATVDKLAQLPWRGFAGSLFGRVDSWCPRHGYRHDDLDDRTGCRDSHQAKGKKLAAVRSQPVRCQLRPPDLIIQDELHLISGALGTTVGLFEAAVDELCGWPTPERVSGAESAAEIAPTGNQRSGNEPTGNERTEGPRTGPKIVASTATTRRASSQVRNLFGRGLRVFPPQVIDSGDTFFSRQVPISEQHPGRRYLGICAHGVRLKQAEIRLMEILLVAGQAMFDRYGAAADPYMTVVDYFNAVRELASMRRYLDDDVLIRVRRQRSGRGLPARLAGRSERLELAELTSRMSSAQIGEMLARVELGFDPEIDTSERSAAIREEYGKARKQAKGNRRAAFDGAHPLVRRRYPHGARRRPVDVVLATSMLQVGVDVSRFGLMVVTGQPKNTAEYIQATSRVGRAKPGLVLTLYNWARPRDLAHFEDFGHYHATFYRQVEALSVTPYTRRALDRGATGTYITAIRHARQDHSRNLDAQDVPLDGELVGAVAGRLIRRAEQIAGAEGAENLRQLIEELQEIWNREKTTAAARLAYDHTRKQGQQTTPLLQRAGHRPWNARTVGMSMRETENEVNLLLPGGDQLFEPHYDPPSWEFSSNEEGSKQEKGLASPEEDAT